jgi:hypothetical protein
MGKSNELYLRIATSIMEIITAIISILICIFLIPYNSLIFIVLLSICILGLLHDIIIYYKLIKDDNYGK